MLPRVLLIVPFALLSCFSPGQDFTDAEMKKYKEKVKKMFYHAYDGYLTYAFPKDELKPLTCEGVDTWGSFSLTLVDALDTLLVMGNASEFIRASELVLESVRWDADVNVSVFETNIRVVGGLLTAHMMQGLVPEVKLEPGWPCAGPLLRLAEKMASRLLPAFNTNTGMPFGTVNLRYGVHKDETPITCTAGVGTFLLEFGALSRLTGDSRYEKAAIRAMDSLWRAKSHIGLVGNHVNVQTGAWTATDAGIGAGVDSYLEYLAKGAILFRRPRLMEQFYEFERAINKYVRKEDWFMWVSMTKATVSLPIFQSLEAFWPGVLTLVGHVGDAARIMSEYSCFIRQYGFPPEFYNIPNAEPTDGRTAFPLRPEMAESLMYLYRATSDPTYLELGAQLVDSIEEVARTECGYATVNKVTEHTLEDRMESFFLAETTKYLYLLFDPDNFLHNDGTGGGKTVEVDGGTCIIHAGGYIFNTEAHPLDPGTIYCCSEHKKAEREAIRHMTRNINVSQILDSNRHSRTIDATIRVNSLPEEILDLNSDDEWYGIERPSREGTERQSNDSERQPEGILELGKAGEEPEEEMSPNEILEKIRDMIQSARQAKYEERRQRMPDSVAQTVAEFLAKRRKPSTVTTNDVLKRMDRERTASTVPIVEADCPSCCYPLDEPTDSSSYRLFLSVVSSRWLYPHHGIPFLDGPICRPKDAPKIEDNYRNTPHDYSTYPLLDNLPYGRVTYELAESEWAKLIERQFELLKGQGKTFEEKRMGNGQVTLNEEERGRVKEARKREASGRKWRAEEREKRRANEEGSDRDKKQPTLLSQVMR